MTFFFSSRRRHTRLQGDWSSDVCSSDLFPGLPPLRDFPDDFLPPVSEETGLPMGGFGGTGGGVRHTPILFVHGNRSEERRVGKECWSREGLEPDNIK